MERTPKFIKIWFWPRHPNVVPSDVLNGNSGSINTDAWGTPTAYFPDTDCDINSKFSPSNIIINLTFCEFSLLSIGCHWIKPCDIQVETGRALSTDLRDARALAKVRYVGGCGLGKVIWKTSLTLIKNPEFVNNNPRAFSNAFFEFNSVRVYQ